MVFPNQIEVELHPVNGQIISYHCTDLNVRFKYQPLISKEKAEDIVQHWIGDYKLRGSEPATVLEAPEANLTVKPAEAGLSARMVWAVHYLLQEKDIRKKETKIIDAMRGGIIGVD